MLWYFLEWSIVKTTQNGRRHSFFSRNFDKDFWEFIFILFGDTKNCNVCNFFAVLFWRKRSNDDGHNHLS